jgi:hypothetical protein
MRPHGIHGGRIACDPKVATANEGRRNATEYCFGSDPDIVGGIDESFEATNHFPTDLRSFIKLRDGPYAHAMAL